MTSWEGVETSGLFNDVDFTIVKAEFGYDAQYNNGEQILFMITSAETDDEGRPYTNFYSLGKAGAWETLDHGRSVVSQSSPPAAGFNKQSLYFKFMEAALSVAQAKGVDLSSRGTPDKASLWEGLTFHMKRVDVDYGGDIGTKQVLLPVAFIGEAGKAEAPSATSVPTEAPAVTTQGGNGATPSALEAKIKFLAKQHATHDEFIEAVMEQYPEATNNEELFGRVLDESGIYAEARS